MSQIPDRLLDSLHGAGGPPPRRQRRTRSALTFVLAVALGFLLSWAINAVKAYRATAGDDVPRQAPTEAQRVVHPEGFSLVFPPNWSVDARDHALSASPRVRGPRRGTPAEIYVAKLGRRGPADLADCLRTTFQGDPALADVRVRADRAPRFERSLFFQRGADWYVLRYVVSEARQTLPWMIQRYFDTFRVEESGT